MSPFNKSAGSIVMHSFLSLELCGSLNTQTHRMKKRRGKKTATQAQNIHKTSQNMSQFIKTVVNSITFSVSTEQPTPKHRHWPAWTSVSRTGEGKVPAHTAVWLDNWPQMYLLDA